MFIKDMRALYDIVQSPRPSNNLVYSRHVTFMFKVTFMLVLLQGKDNSYTVKKYILNDFIWRSNGSNLFWGNMPHLVLVSIDLAGIYSTPLQSNFHTLIQGREHSFCLSFIYWTSTLYEMEISEDRCEKKPSGPFL